MTRNIFLTLAFFTTLVLSVTAQNRSFTGTIKYQITYPGNANSQFVASLPKTLDMQIAGNKAKFGLTLPNGQYTFIINGDEMSVTRLIDAAEGKFYIKKTKEEFIKGEAPVILPGKETKSVAGYKCKSAEITVAEAGGAGQKSKVFYSEDLGTNNIYFNTSAKGIKGMLLDMDYTTMGVTLHLTATEIDPGRISNKAFEIPSGYTETTEAQLRQLKQGANKKK